MKSLVLEKQHQFSLREFPIDEPIGPHDVRIALQTVGICGSDVHCYQHGGIDRTSRLSVPLVFTMTRVVSSGIGVCI
ncbi:MAG TPA: alcohol dehydrogenase catalytic domain-containing protein [Terrimicrobiaceae bacterium]